MARYTMHDLIHDLATLIMADELIVSDVASKSNNTHGQKYCRYALVTKYDQAQATKLSYILPSKVRALHFSDCNKLDVANGAFSFAKCLRILDFSGCSSVQLPASIGKLKQLKYLFAPRMQNDVLPEYINGLAKLQYLNLKESSRISALPESIGKLSGCLEFLGLSGCSGISELPASFGDLKCMMYLDMSGCSAIKELPDSVGHLTNLQRLELSGCNSLKAIPESLCGLTQLQYLSLEFCTYIVRLPEAIGCLVDLQYLNLSHCGVTELPLHLELALCSIKKELPRALRGLTRLEYLDMSWNGLVVGKMEKDDLLDAMKSLTSLKVLYLSGCLKRCFDVKKNDAYLDFIGTLTNLEHLDLSSNGELEYLPESIGNLKRLHTLNLRNCSGLMSLPVSISGATGLKSLVLDGCSHEVMDQATSLLHYSLTLPLFKVRADDISGYSNLHQLQGESDIGGLNIVSLENVRFLEEAQRLKLSAKQNLVKLTLSWTKDAHRLIEDKDLLGELVPPMSLKSFRLEGYSSPSFPSWLMVISHHLSSLTQITLDGLPKCSNLPPLGQLLCLESLFLSCAPGITKIDSGFCGGAGAFPRLKRVDVSDMDGLEEWNTTYIGEAGVEEFMFPVLERLEVSWCPRLRLKPCPPNSKSLVIRTSDQVISSLEEIETSSHYVRNSTPTTRLLIHVSQRQSFRLFHHFPALQHLQLGKCPNLGSLPEGIRHLSSLQSLALRSCDSISALPEWLSDISSLKELHICECTSIKSLPQCIQQLTNLQKLVIYGNQELRQWCESEENKAKLAHIKEIVSSQLKCIYHVNIIHAFVIHITNFLILFVFLQVNYLN